MHFSGGRQSKNHLRSVNKNSNAARTSAYSMRRQTGNNRPGIGQRLKVRFKDRKKYLGSIMSVALSGDGRYKLMIRYDDGEYESTSYPDKDIELLE